MLQDLWYFGLTWLHQPPYHLQLILSYWFDAQWFGFLGFPNMKGIVTERGTPTHHTTNPNQQLIISWKTLSVWLCLPHLPWRLTKLPSADHHAFPPKKNYIRHPHVLWRPFHRETTWQNAHRNGGNSFPRLRTTEAVGLIEGPLKSVNQQNWWIDMGVSENRGTPKSSILIGISIIFTIHFGVPLFLETPICQPLISPLLEPYMFIHI